MDAKIEADKVQAIFDRIKSKGGLGEEERKYIVEWLVKNKAMASELVNSGILTDSMNDELSDALIEVYKYEKSHVP